MTGYKALMTVSAQFDDMVEGLVEWIFQNEAELTEAGECADYLNDMFCIRLKDVCDGDEGTMEAVRGEVAVRVDAQGEFAVTRQWAAQWA